MKGEQCSADDDCASGHCRGGRCPGGRSASRCLGR
jgi:hypothetical protein